MFDKTSRYQSIETATLTVTDADGKSREVRYVRRRFVPRADESLTMSEHTVIDGERPDTIAARYLGDPTRFWQLCDANTTMHPDELTEEAGKSVRIPMPKL